MKKNLIKSTLAVAFLTVAGLGGMKAYEKHDTFNGDDLLSLNIEALSDGEVPSPKYALNTVTDRTTVTKTITITNELGETYEETITEVVETTKTICVQSETGTLDSCPTA